jgi:hypothetical protein
MGAGCLDLVALSVLDCAGCALIDNSAKLPCDRGYGHRQVRPCATAAKRSPASGGDVYPAPDPDLVKVVTVDTELRGKRESTVAALLESDTLPPAIVGPECDSLIDRHSDLAAAEIEFTNEKADPAI